MPANTDRTPEDRITVRAYHNVAVDTAGRPMGFLGYQPGQPVVLVYEDRDVPSADPIQICDDVFRLLNVGDDPDFGTRDARAVAYRERGNRSLSVGDVIALATDGAAAYYAVASRGFDRIEPPQVVTVARLGTAALG